MESSFMRYLLSVGVMMASLSPHYHYHHHHLHHPRICPEIQVNRRKPHFDIQHEVSKHFISISNNKVKVKVSVIF